MTFAAWGRADAKTLKDRTHEYQEGVIIGQGYSTIAWIPEEQGSWALPFLHERISSGESPIPKAAEQLKQVCKQITNRDSYRIRVKTCKIDL